MNQFRQLFFAAALACGVSMGAAASAAAFRVLAAPGVPGEAAESVCAALEEGARLEKSAPGSIAESLPEGTALSGYVEPAAGADPVFVLVNDASCTDVGHLDPAARVAVVNLAALVADAPSPEAADWRLRREALRAYAWLLGVPPCPFPLCVLLPCGAASDLDGMSRSYCPPCWERVRDRALEAGLPVLPLQTP